MPELTIKISISQEAALELAQRLARDDDFRAQLAANPVDTLDQHGISISHNEEVAFAPVLPPKHIVEEALINVAEASEFASSEGFEHQNAFAFWLFVIFAAT
jgi:hypothetical protein